MQDIIHIQPGIKVKISKYLEDATEPYAVEEHELTKEEAEALCHSLQQA